LKSVTPPEVKTGDIYKGILPFILIQIAMVVLIYLFPQFIQGQQKQVYKDTPLQLDLPLNGGYQDPYSNPSQGTVPFVPKFSQPNQ
ncbi:MAG TPA: C4-dicarboxylate ABC transporter, partial [Limnobacter sp.]|nr:C4-dicarboxylate ABC transporter [Limnobacter sp.]